MRQTERQLENILAYSAYILLALVVILAMVWLIVRIRTWYLDREDDAAVDQLMLSEIRDLHRRGDLSEEEYRSIKSEIVQRLDDGERASQGTGPAEETHQSRNRTESADSTESEINPNRGDQPAGASQ